MTLEDKYYQIVGVGKDATLQDIAKAYRKKALQLHPDKNKHPDATRQFIELEEAYEYLKKLKSRQISPNRDAAIEEFEQWWRREEEEIRRRAQQRSEMKFKDFKDDEDIKSDWAIDTVYNFFLSIITGIVYIVSPILLSIIKGWFGFIVSIVIIFITSPLTAPILRSLFSKELSLGGIKEAFLMIVRSNKFQVIILTFLNLLLFYYITFHTLIYSKYLIPLFGIPPILIVGGFYIFKKSSYFNRKNTIAFCLYPLLINFVFVSNYVLSFNTTQETYYYDLETQSYPNKYGNRRRTVQTTLMVLENNKYNEYFGIRFFVFLDDVSLGNTVTYTFKQGFLGLRVMTGRSIKHVE